MIKSNNIRLFLVLFIVISLFTKIDFRLKDDIECCNDDNDYFIHAETTALDLDFDYRNQLEGFEKRRNYINSKPSPVGFYGAGLLSTPFLLLGNTLDVLTDSAIEGIYTNKVMFYSFSAIFYLIFTFIVLQKIKNLLKINLSDKKLLIIFFGTGLPYYAFERFSMTHVYDTFSVTLLIYFLILFYNHGDKKYIFWISLFNLVTLLVRWTNYQIILLPFIVKKLFFSESSFKLRKFKEFYLFTFLSVGIFLAHTKAIWGIYTFNPRKLYNDHEFISYYFDSMIETPVNFILNNFTDAFLVLFTKEFGVLWFSPVIFVGVLYIVFSIKKNIVLWLSIFITFAYYFSLVNAWQSTGNAYGFRYLYPLISLSILLFFYLKRINFNYIFLIENILLLLSFFSLMSVLFFEGWEGSQLSLIPIENSFGKIEKFVQPNYLDGFIRGFFLLETYLKILTTSFISLIGFKFLLYFIDIENLNIYLGNFGLPVENTDFQNFLMKVENINTISYLFIITLLMLSTTLIYKSLLKKQLS